MSESEGVPGGRGFFLALEGIDGAGTTTQASLLARALCDWDVLVTAEPSRGPVGRFLRELLRSGSDTDPALLALLFAADRLHHVREEVEPALQTGRFVVSDRYVWSSLAYQSVDLPLDWVRSLNHYAPEPDLVVLVDVPVSVALQRIGSRGVRDLYEAPDVLERVRSRYLELAGTADAGAAVVVDGTRRPRQVLEAILAGVRKRLEDQGRRELLARVPPTADVRS